MTRRGRTGGVKRVAFRRPCSRPVLGTKFSPDAVLVASRLDAVVHQGRARRESSPRTSPSCWDLSARCYKGRPQGPSRVSFRFSGWP